jgi:hemerythrin-like domain-containing protein
LLRSENAGADEGGHALFRHAVRAARKIGLAGQVFYHHQSSGSRRIANLAKETNKSTFVIESTSYYAERGVSEGKDGIMSAFEDPIIRFMDEHQQGLRELRNMLHAAKELKLKGYDPELYEKLHDAARFINEEIKAHNQNEENALFPALEEKIGKSGPTAVMRDEHQQLWEALERLESELNLLLTDGINNPRIARIAELATFIHDFLSQHIGKEDNILYPLARRVLNGRELQEVSRKMAGVPEPMPPSV